jgi:hypothetical protein
MTVRRAVLLGLAIVLTLGLVAVPANAKVKKVKVETEVFIDDFEVGLSTVTFFGHLEARKAKCLKQRTVHLENVDLSIDVGSDKTDSDGDWEVTFDQTKSPPGNYQATADKKKYKKKKNGEVVKKIICKAGVSEVFPAFP